MENEIKCIDQNEFNEEDLSNKELYKKLDRLINDYGILSCKYNSKLREIAEKGQVPTEELSMELYRMSDLESRAIQLTNRLAMEMANRIGLTYREISDIQMENINERQ